MISKNLDHQAGQAILILLLVMTVALAIGLSVVQRSLTDVTTATKVEQSSRAFSAAEAGIERALTSADNLLDTELSQVEFEGSKSNAYIFDSGLLPLSKQALEYPPVAKEDIAHVWLADPSTEPIQSYYKKNSLDIYWGEQGISDPANRPAIEIAIIYAEAGAYKAKRYYLDSNASRAGDNGFTDVSGTCSDSLAEIATSMGPNRKFYCKFTLITLPSELMILRARMLYNNTNQPFAVKPVCAPGDAADICSLPPQARVITSIGLSGETERRVQLFKLEKVVPPYFDYSIFSAGDINK